MEAGDLFDVIHVIYEEDITPLWEQHIDVKDRVREALYPMLYGKKYLFSSTKAAGGSGGMGGGSFEGSDPDGFPETFGDTGNEELKPYIPVTSEEDLMKVLGGPMGG